MGRSFSDNFKFDPFTYQVPFTHLFHLHISPPITAAGNEVTFLHFAPHNSLLFILLEP